MKMKSVENILLLDIQQVFWELGGITSHTAGGLVLRKGQQLWDWQVHARWTVNVNAVSGPGNVKTKVPFITYIREENQWHSRSRTV